MVTGSLNAGEGKKIALLFTSMLLGNGIKLLLNYFKKQNKKARTLVIFNTLFFCFALLIDSVPFMI